MSKVFPKPKYDPTHTGQEPMDLLEAWFEVSEIHAVAWAIEQFLPIRLTQTPTRYSIL